jgi:hypothetical protein
MCSVCNESRVQSVIGASAAFDCITAYAEVIHTPDGRVNRKLARYGSRLVSRCGQFRYCSVSDQPEVSPKGKRVITAPRRRSGSGLL